MNRFEPKFKLQLFSFSIVARHPSGSRGPGDERATAVPGVERRATWLVSFGQRSRSRVPSPPWLAPPGQHPADQLLSASRAYHAWDSARRGSHHTGGAPQAGCCTRRCCCGCGTARDVTRVIRLTPHGTWPSPPRPPLM